MHKSIFASQCKFVFQSYFYRASQKKSLLLSPLLKLICPFHTKGTLLKRLVGVDRTDNSLPERNIKAKFCLGHPVQKQNLWNCCEVASRVFPLMRKMQIYWVAKIADQSRDLLGSRKSNCLTTVNGLFFQMWAMCKVWAVATCSVPVWHLSYPGQSVPWIATVKTWEMECLGTKLHTILIGSYPS